MGASTAVRKSLGPMMAASKKSSKNCLVASTSKGFSQKKSKCVTSMEKVIQGSGIAGDIGLFLLTTAALEIVRRFSRAKCPFVWRGLQALQVLQYPPFKWLQKWAPFKVLVKHTQSLSRPMLVLSIATLFSDQSENDTQVHSESQSEPSSQLSTPDTSTEKWLLELHKELESQSITLPERLDEDELRRFYASSNRDFLRFLSSVKKTILWRQTYCFFSPQELKDWSHLVFWHGCDVKLRPCLIIRLGLACSNLSSKGRSHRTHLAKAVVSQMEHGVLNLVDVERPQITVLMDCEGLSPFGFPMQVMRSCAILLQDHYPNRLGFLIVIRLPPVTRVITQTLFRVLRPATRRKLRIVGENYQEVLSEYLQTLAYCLGGNCTCSICVKLGNKQGTNEEIIQTRPRVDRINDAYVTSPDFCYRADASMNGNKEQIKKTIVFGVLILWLVIAFILKMHYPEILPSLY